MTDTSKTAKIIKRWYHSPSHSLTVSVLLNTNRRHEQCKSVCGNRKKMKERTKIKTIVNKYGWEDNFHSREVSVKGSAQVQVQVQKQTLFFIFWGVTRITQEVTLYGSSALLSRPVWIKRNTTDVIVTLTQMVGQQFCDRRQTAESSCWCHRNDPPIDRNSRHKSVKGQNSCSVRLWIRSLLVDLADGPRRREGDSLLDAGRNRSRQGRTRRSVIDVLVVEGRRLLVWLRNAASLVKISPPAAAVAAAAVFNTSLQWTMSILCLPCHEPHGAWLKHQRRMWNHFEKKTWKCGLSKTV